MPSARALYLSSNGDRWLLERDEATGHALVLHQANAASGGTLTRLSVGDFCAAATAARSSRRCCA